MTYMDLANELVKRLERCRLVGYSDSGGVPTDGYGHTGPEVQIGKMITQTVADRNLSKDLIIADMRLQAACQPGSLERLTAHQRAALISFVFNLGANDTWQIWRDIDAGNLADVPVQMRRFNKIKNRKTGEVVTVRGLTNRREAEVAFWNTGDSELAGALARPSITPPSSEIRVAETPPTPAPAPPLAKTSLVAKATTVIGGIGAYVATQAQQVHGVIAPYVSHARIYQTLDTIVIGAIITAGIVGLLIHAYQANRRSQ